jgi:ATP-binding cassette subfamily B protein
VNQIKSLWHHLTARRQKQTYLILILMIISSLSEVVSIGLVLPFLGVLTAPEQIYQHQLMQPVIELFEITSAEQLFLPLTIGFIAATIFAGTIRLILLYVMTRFSFATGADLSINIYQRTLYQDYDIHVSRNSSEVISGITSKTGKVSGIIHHVLTIISAAFILIGVMTVLFAIHVVIALVTLISFSFLYWIVIRYTKKRIKENGDCIATHSTQIIKSLQEGLGGIRDVLIDGSQQFYCKLYRSADLPLRKASGNNMFISGSPRFVMEALGITLIALLAFALSQSESGVTTAIPMLGALALGAQRMLPTLQQAYASYSTIKGNQASMRDVIELLNQPLPDYANQHQPDPIQFENEISINNLSFCYGDQNPWVVKDISLTITKGSRIGFMGTTGSGKSTLVDIIMALLTPTTGIIAIDGEVINKKNCRTWQAHIAHVPQNVFLSDSSIEENIAFGIHPKNIDSIKVKKAAEQAQISELISSWKDGYNTFVGERGIRLSGGQRQRIGIARALYKDADVLVFDEATSALDNKTEKSVMDAIEGLNKDLTILIIAHRLTTLSVCDRIIELKNGSIFEKQIK